MKKRVIALALGCTVAFGCAVGGTLAWLTDSTNSVTNTFTTSDINITLNETTGDNYKMVPGHTIAKDPKVTVTDGSEPCYVFVKIEKSDNYGDYLTDYTVRDGWTQLKDANNADVEGIYWQKWPASGGKEWTEYVLAGQHDTGCNKDDSCNCENANGYVTVNYTVTKKLMEEIKNSNQPTLTFTAYASQLMKDNTTEFKPYEAWNNVFDANADNQPDTPTT